MSKKTFKTSINSPAMAFISQPNEAPAQAEENVKAQEKPQKTANKAIKDTAPKGYKLDPKYIELKSRRVQLVFQPSLYERIKRAADKQGISFNEYCHTILDKATKE